MADVSCPRYPDCFFKKSLWYVAVKKIVVVPEVLRSCGSDCGQRLQDLELACLCAGDGAGVTARAGGYDPDV